MIFLVCWIVLASTSAVLARIRHGSHRLFERGDLGQDPRGQGRMRATSQGAQTAEMISQLREIPGAAG